MATLPTKKKYEPAMERTTADILNDLGRAAAQGATMGFSDEIYGLYQEFMGNKSYEEARDEIRQGLERYKDTDPVKAHGLEIASAILSAGIGGAVTLGAKIGTRVGAGLYGALEGGLYGAGTAEEMSDVPAGVGVGMATGAIGGMLGQQLTPKVTETAKKLIDRGYPLTAGQAMGGTVKSLEEKMSLPFLREAIQEAQQRPVTMFRRDTVQNAIEGLNVKLPKNLEGEELVEFAEDQISEAYEKVVPKLSIDTDPVSGQAATIAGNRKMSGAFSDQDVEDFNKLIADTFNRNVSDGKLSKQLLKDTESEISSEIRALMRGGASDRRLGKALREFQDVLRDEIAKQNPDVPDLQKINKAFARMKPIIKAKESALGRGGQFTPTQLLRAQRQMRVPRTSPEVQLAREARDVLGVSTPSSGTAERLLASRPTSSLLGLAGAAIAEPLYGTGLGRYSMRELLLPTTGRAIKYGSPVAGQTGLLDDFMTVSP
jgi:hypothetical protein